MGAVYSVLELAYNIFYLRNTHSAVDNRFGDSAHLDGNLDTTDCPNVASSATLKRAETGDVDKRNIIVICAGKRVELDVFPDERVAILRQGACEILGKKPNCMSIVSNGEVLDVGKRIRDYNLRAGQVVNLIRNAS